MTRGILRKSAIVVALGGVIAGLGIAKQLDENTSRRGDGAGVRFSKAAERKIDPELRELASQLDAAGRSGAALRVVIDITTDADDVTMQTAFGTDRAQQVADAVIGKQTEFLDALDRSFDLATSTSLEVLDLLTLQYSIVAEIGDRETLDRLAARDDVAFVWHDRLNVPLTIEGRQITGSAAAASSGYDGSGIGVAVIDSHFDLLHPELGGSTSLPNGIVAAGVNFSDPGTSVHSRNYGDCYHGTGTASIVRRYAPDVDLYCHTVFPNAYDSVIANSINWCVTNQSGAGGGAPIRVISMSLGGGRYYSACNSGTLHTAAGNAVAAGILVFAASGNDGWSNSMGSPACSSNVISVGSVWDENGASYSPFPPAYCSDSNRLVNERACYSDTASFLDIYAPSEEVICARCGGGTAPLGGTSSACPAAAGMTAQLLEADSSLYGDKSGLVSLYQSTGVTVTGDTSKRRIDLTAAIGGGGGGGTTELTNGNAESFTLATGATTSFIIEVPANASNLVVSTTGSGDADLYVKRAAINWPGDQGQHDEPEFKAPYIGGSSESVTFPSPAADTWNVLVHGYSASSGSITATWETSGGGGGGPDELANGVSTPFSVSTGSTTEFTIPVPASTTSLNVSISGSGDADLYVKRATINWPGDQGQHDEAEFKAPYIGGSSESVDFTNPAQDTWNVLIHGYSGNPSGSIVANWTVDSGGGDPEWHYENYVRQTPHNYANNSTYTFTYSSPGASNVAVHFTTLNTEANYDFLRVYDENDTLQYTVSGNLISNGSGSAFGRTDGWVVLSGSEIRVELVTDYSVTRYGYLTDMAAAYY